MLARLDQAMSEAQTCCERTYGHTAIFLYIVPRTMDEMVNMTADRGVYVPAHHEISPRRQNQESSLSSRSIRPGTIRSSQEHLIGEASHTDPVKARAKEIGWPASDIAPSSHF